MKRGKRTGTEKNEERVDIDNREVKGEGEGERVGKRKSKRREVEMGAG